MTLRELGREFRDYPATMALCVLWTIVFAAIAHAQLTGGVTLPWWKWLLIGSGDGHAFGDLTLPDLGRGQVWRLETSTFVHFSALHFVLNVMGMYLIGTMVESWYGPSQLVLIYGLTGGVGNLVAALARYLSGSDPRIHSGGGSVVIMGLVGLCAVVGWRSGTPSGTSMGRVMVVILVLTALLGIALPQYIDNWGHAGGVLVGAVLGFAHTALERAGSRPWVWGAGVLMGIVLLVCGAAQLIDKRTHAVFYQEEAINRRLFELGRSHQALTAIVQLVPREGGARIALGMIDGLNTYVFERPVRAELERLRSLIKTATKRALTADELREFEERSSRVLKETYRAYRAGQRKLWELHRDPRYHTSRRM